MASSLFKNDIVSILISTEHPIPEKVLDKLTSGIGHHVTAHINAREISVDLEKKILQLQSDFYNKVLEILMKEAKIQDIPLPEEIKELQYKSKLDFELNEED